MPSLFLFVSGGPLVVAEGWRAQCNGSAANISLPAADLGVTCMMACRNLDYCAFVSMDLDKQICELYRKDANCRFSRTKNRMLMAYSLKNFQLVNGTGYGYYDIPGLDSQFVADPTDIKTLEMATTLCKIHPRCNVASWQFDLSRIWLKDFPMATVANTSGYQFGSLVLV